MSEWSGFTRCKFKYKKPQTPIVNGQCYASGQASETDYCQTGLFKESLTSNQVADAIKMITLNTICRTENTIGTNDISSVELCFYICNTLFNFTYAALNG